MSAHTPGPWEADNHDNELGECDHWSVFEPSGIIIARVWACGSNPEQDARLIAAAPDLYEALNGLFGLLQMIGARADITPELRTILVGGQAENHRITAARAALAKARGEQ